MGYPVAYRSGSTQYASRTLPSAFRDALGLTETELRKVAINPEAAKQTFQRLPVEREFGKRLLTDLAEQQLRKSARRVLTRFIPILGEVLIARDIGEFFGDVVSQVITYPDAHYEPGPPVGDPVDPSKVYRRGWTHVIPQPSNDPDIYELERPDLYLHPSGSSAVRPQGYSIADVWPEPFGEMAHYVRFSVYGEPRWYPDDTYLPNDDAQAEPAYEGDVTTHPGPDVYVPGDPVETTVTTPLYVEGDATVPARIIPGLGREVGHETRPLKPTLLPYEIPVLVIEPNKPAEPGVHLNVPPGPATKERKVKMSRAASFLWHAVGHVTEAADAYKAFWDALPDSAKSGYYRIHTKGGRTKYVKRWFPTPDQMAKDLYRHWDKVDMKQALTNVAMNEVQDALIGGVNKRINEGFRPWYNLSRRPLGITAGPWDKAFTAPPRPGQ